MSDIAITIPTWAMPFLLAAFYWPVLLGISILLAVAGALMRGRGRVFLLGLAAVAVLPCLAVGAAVLVSDFENARARQAEARRHETLAAPRQIDGLDLPAGTVVEWTDELHVGIVAIELAGPAVLLGALVTGRLENVAGRWWSGRLAKDVTLRGWPCRAGEVWLAPSGHPLRCVLSADHEAVALEIPAGSEVELTESGQLRNIQLSPDRDMRLPLVDATLPRRGSVFFDPCGAMERVYVVEPGVLRVAGLNLRFNIVWRYADTPAGPASRPVAVVGSLAADTRIDGATVPAGSELHIDLVTRQVAVRSTP